jgi:4-alpha-glucanotransferase
LFGDVPIFVAYDSADVWANRALFKLNKRGEMTVVAGVPPDYFSETGQHWGNPHYNWHAMRQDGFKWWLARMRTQKQLFDIVRIDHFRGFEAAWEIPARDKNAINGQWRRASGKALLKAITEKFPNMQLVAEDLGIITPKVDALRQQYKLPGMKILQFAFGGDDNNPYLPHNIFENSVAYTGTHDNDTTLGWYQSLDENAKNHVHRVLESAEPAMPQALTALVLASKANLAIIPMQDILGLDATHRMNTPGTVVGNWQWRFTWNMLDATTRDSIKNAIKQSNRAIT